MYNLLIVDDEAIIRRGIKSLVDFEKLNIGEVFEASNGNDGLKIFNEHSIHMVLADINMPLMNGLEMAKKMKEIAPKTKIALITGYDYFDYAVTALKSGVDDYILKPVSRKDIEELLVKLVDKAKKDMEVSELNKVIKDIQISSENDHQTIMEQFIQSNLGNSQLSLQLLAEEMGFSNGYLSGLFKKTFGVTFSDYVLNKRLDKAKILLLSSDLKIYEIAEGIGITDPNYFSAIFKKKIGLSPNQYKESIKK